MGRKIKIALGSIGVLALGTGAYLGYTKAYNFRNGVYSLLTEIENKVDANTGYTQDLLDLTKDQKGVVTDSIGIDSLSTSPKDSSATLENKVDDQTDIPARASSSTEYPGINNTNTSESNPTINITNTFPGYGVPIAPSYSTHSDTVTSPSNRSTGKYTMNLTIENAYVAQPGDMTDSEIVINKDGIKVNNKR